MTIAEFRKKYHLKQGDVAELLGLSHKQQISDRERGVLPPSERDRLLLGLWDFIAQQGYDIWEVFKKIKRLPYNKIVKNEKNAWNGYYLSVKGKKQKRRKKKMEFGIAINNYGRYERAVKIGKVVYLWDSGEVAISKLEFGFNLQTIKVRSNGTNSNAYENEIPEGMKAWWGKVIMPLQIDGIVFVFKKWLPGKYRELIDTREKNCGNGLGYLTDEYIQHGPDKFEYNFGWFQLGFMA